MNDAERLLTCVSALIEGALDGCDECMVEGNRKRGDVVARLLIDAGLTHPTLVTETAK